LGEAKQLKSLNEKFRRCHDDSFKVLREFWVFEENIRWKINIESSCPFFKQGFETRHIQGFELGLVVIDVLKLELNFTLFFDTELLKNDSLSKFK
jgi:hypothetical protein